MFEAAQLAVDLTRRGFGFELGQAHAIGWIADIERAWIPVIAIGIDLAGTGVISAVAVWVAQTSLHGCAPLACALVFGQRLAAAVPQTTGIDAGVILTVFVGITETLYNGRAAGIGTKDWID
jgi:hypothetical protein